MSTSEIITQAKLELAKVATALDGIKLALAGIGGANG